MHQDKQFERVQQHQPPHSQVLHVLAMESLTVGKRLQMLSERAYPSTGLKNVIADLYRINQRCGELLEELRAIDKPFSSDEQAAPVSAVFEVLRLITEITNAIAAADFSSHPAEIMLFFKDIGVEINPDMNVEFITNPIEARNFNVIELWAPLLDAVTKAKLPVEPSTSLRLVKFSFPVLHRDNALIGAIYAHELGHYLDGGKLTERLFAEAMKIDVAEQLVASAKGQDQTPLSREKAREFLRHYLLGPWIKELIADAVGIYLLGPAFELAASDVDVFLLGSSYPRFLDELGNSHPPAALRYDHRFALLCRLGYFQRCPEPVRRHILMMKRCWRDAGRTYPAMESKVVYHMVEQALRQLLPRIDKAVVELLPPEVGFRAEELTSTVEPLVSRLKGRLPPNELDGHPVSPAAILNAGWFHFFQERQENRRVKPGHRNLREFETLEHINELVRYALFASRIHRRWEQ